MTASGDGSSPDTLQLGFFGPIIAKISLQLVLTGRRATTVISTPAMQNELG
jgi:hypothetical protein